MTPFVCEDVLSDSDIQTLLDFNDRQDELTDARPDFTTKRPIWDQTDFPQDILSKALHKILPQGFQIDTVVFVTSRASFRLHTDSDVVHDDTIDRVVLMPLRFSGEATTVLFDNHYLGPGSVFGRSNIGPYRYSLPDRDGNFVWVDDIRDLLHRCQHLPHTVTEFEVDQQFVQELQDLIQLRSKVKPRITDYSQITNHDEDQSVDQELYERYLHHIPRQDLQGLKLHMIYHWQRGQALCFPRTQIHCAGAGHESKVGVSIWTRKGSQQ